MQLTKSFTLEEFFCRDGTPIPPEYIDNVIKLANNLQVLRDDLNKNRPTSAPKGVIISLAVTSGYRTPDYNKKVGGKPASKHLIALAADLTSQWVTPKVIYNRVEKLIKAGKMDEGGLHAYAGFTHYDPRGTKARW